MFARRLSPTLTVLMATVLTATVCLSLADILDITEDRSSRLAKGKTRGERSQPKLLCSSSLLLLQKDVEAQQRELHLLLSLTFDISSWNGGDGCTDQPVESV